MKSIRMHSQGGPELLAYEDAARPALQPGDALVRVIASSITKTELTWDETYRDCDGRPRIPTIPGHEFAGIVDVLAPEDSGVRVGDAVYALSSFCRDGSAAEFIAIRAADLAPKPHSLNFEQAAAVPLAGLTAWQALFDHAQIKKGERVLIHGAAGGVGTYAVQLANWKGAEVIATASAKDSNFVGELGASEVIDYTHGHFEEKVNDVDVVLDTIGGETQERSWGVLRRGGILISIVGPVASEKAASLGVRGTFFIVEPNRTQLIQLSDLIDRGTLRVVVGAVLPLARAREAFEQGSMDHKRGKIVLQVAAAESAKA
ncbi:MAG TPA: NADP-dependent oxidoreductase [Candidatus Acidoferrales bacterium]|jgi:NADPH:quinone reductase-like Zn-dependent oxidoreductase|nr:NADP-dependent oxidoreductase [Candidatus Acidoferrales bacterium]